MTNSHAEQPNQTPQPRTPEELENLARRHEAAALDFLMTAMRKAGEQVRANSDSGGIPQNANADSPYCPFCGWDRRTYTDECPHFLTDISEWPETHAGTEGGAFDPIADKTLGPLAAAVWGLSESIGHHANRIGSAIPDRLRPLVQALIQRGEPYDHPEAEANVAKSVFAEYVESVFRRVAPDGRINSYDTGDVYGTWPLLYWSPDAARTTRDMARLIAEDVETLKRATLFRSPRPSRRPRPR